MHTKNRFLQGIYPVRRGRHRQARPAGARAELRRARRHRRARRCTSAAATPPTSLITVVLMRDGVPMRYFPIGAKSDVHVPLRVVEDIEGGSVRRAVPRRPRADRHRSSSTSALVED